MQDLNGGDLLKYIRELVGLTQKEFADLFGYTQQAVSMMESNDRPVPSAIYMSIKSKLLARIESVVEIITTLDPRRFCQEEKC